MSHDPSSSSLQELSACPQCGLVRTRPVRFCTACGYELPSGELPPTEQVVGALNGSGRRLPGTAEVLVVPGYHTRDFSLPPKDTPSPLPDPPVVKPGRITKPLSPPRGGRVWSVGAIFLVLLTAVGLVAGVGYVLKQKRTVAPVEIAQTTPIPDMPEQRILQQSEEATLGTPSPGSSDSAPSSSGGGKTTPSSPTGAPGAVQPDKPSGSNPSKSSKPEPGKPAGTERPPVPSPSTAGGTAPSTNSKPSTLPAPAGGTTRTDTASDASGARPGRRTESDVDPEEPRSSSTGTRLPPTSPPDEDRSAGRRGGSRTDPDDDSGAPAPPRRGGSTRTDPDDVSSIPPASNPGANVPATGAASWSGLAGATARITVYGFPGVPIAVKRPVVRGGAARIVTPPSPSNGWKSAVVEIEKSDGNCTVSIPWRKL